MEGVVEENLQLAIVAIGTKKYQDYFTFISEKFPQKVVIVSDTEKTKQNLYMASDMFLSVATTSECETELKTAMRYGVVPLSLPMEGLENYNPNQENGNSFLQKGESYWNVFSNLIRALENFRFPYDWKNIVKTTMESV